MPPFAVVENKSPRHDLLGEERQPISQRRRTLSLFLTGLLLCLICIRIQGIHVKAHQSLSGSNDQTIDNIQRTMRTYSESGSGSQSAIKLWETHFMLGPLSFKLRAFLAK